LKERTRLLHGDRVLFGTSNLFVFVHPTDPTTSSSTPTRVDYEFAQSELAKASGFAMDGKDAEEHRRIEAVLEMLPLIGEVNAMAEEMNKGLQYEIALVSSHLLGSGQGPPTTHVMVRAKEEQSGNEWLLDRGFFMERRFEIQVRRGRCRYTLMGLTLLPPCPLPWLGARLATRLPTRNGPTAVTRRARSAAHRPLMCVFPPPPRIGFAWSGRLTKLRCLRAAAGGPLCAAAERVCYWRLLHLYQIFSPRLGV
jgi:hypothetical protein